MEPSVTVTGRLVEPPNTFRATSQLQMWDMKLNPSPAQLFSIPYAVGIAPHIQNVEFTVRNLAVSHDLIVRVTLPSWISMNGLTEFMLNRNGERKTFMLSFNEEDARDKSKTFTRQFNENILISAAPQAITGPVYVMISPQPL